MQLKKKKIKEVVNAKKIIQKYKSMSAPLKSGVWFTLCGFLQKAISMICTPIFTRILTEKQYGRASTLQHGKLS